MALRNIETACKQDKRWRLIAYNILKDKDVADDIVQEMYLKINDVTKLIDDGYIIITIRNLCYNYLKKKKDIPLITDPRIEHNINFGVTDYEQEILDRFKEEKWYRQVLIEESYYKSIRKIAKEYNVDYGFVFRESKKGRENIINNIKICKENKENKKK